MALYIKQAELYHRIANGFLTHDGVINGEFYDIWQDYGINLRDPKVDKIINVVGKIIDSMDDYGVHLYPREYRGCKVRDIRLSKGVTVTALSKRTGLSKTAIYRLEAGASKPSQETMIKIATALNVDVSDFE